jgi:UDP-N-acetylglucosamine 4-epimerase
MDNLETGYLKNLEPFFENPAFTFLKADITDLRACKEATGNCDIVFHQAALGSVPRSIKDPIATNKANVDGFLNMLVASVESGVKRFIYAASSSTYGDSKILPKKEENIGKPLSPYAVTKYVNELYADVFSKTYNLETVGLRYFNVFGPRQSPNGAYAAVIPKFIHSILEECSPVIDGDGEQTRDFTYIENVIQANIKAALSDNILAVNQVYNVAVGERTSVKDLFCLLKDISKSSIEETYREARKGDVRDSLADIS